MGIEAHSTAECGNAHPPAAVGRLSKGLENMLTQQHPNPEHALSHVASVWRVGNWRKIHTASTYYVVQFAHVTHSLYCKKVDRTIVPPLTFFSCTMFESRHTQLLQI